MSTPRPRATIALVVWTFLVWTTRISNVWGDDALTTGEKWGRTALALSFTVLAAAVGWASWQRAAWARSAVLALVGWTIGVWAVRSVGIATGDHSAAFVIVHLALATISIALATLVVRGEPRVARV
jgi:hypothetical protein